MGAAQSGVVKDMVGAVSPWTSIVHVKNCTATPVVVFLAHDPKDPSHADAARFEVPANDTLPISSGYLNEPRATLILRTGLHEAKIFRVPNAGRLLVSLAPHGLKVETVDRVEVSDYPNAHDVEGRDTVPMVARGESFENPHHEHVASAGSTMDAVQSAAKDMVSAVSPWTSIVHVKNTTASPVIVLLAHDPKEPSAADALRYEVPASDTLAISSGYLHEPRATLIIRTELEKAQIFRVPNAGRLLVSLLPHGLKVETTDAVEVSEYADPHAVEGHDTVPMLLRGESFSAPSSHAITATTTSCVDARAEPVLLGRSGLDDALPLDLKHHTSLHMATDRSIDEQASLQRHVSKLGAPQGLEQ